MTAPLIRHGLRCTAVALSPVKNGWQMEIAELAAPPTANTLTYNGDAQTSGVTVKDGAATLAKDTDYALSGHTAVDAGTYTATVTGMGNYTGTLEKE